MAGARRGDAALQPLADDDVTRLRTELERGARPRVVVRAASAAVPAGTRGSVVGMGDPSEGEFIVVRLKDDDVPFAPGELALPSRRRAAAAGAVPAPAAPAAPVASAAPGRKASPPPTSVPPTPPAAPAAAARRPAAATARKPSTGRRKPPPSLSITLRFSGAAWTVEATRGGKRIGKALPVRAGAARRIGELIGATQITDLVAETVDACRSEVAERAAELRARLDAAEAELAEYDG